MPKETHINPEKWDRIQDIFFAACDLPANDRLAYVNSVCGDDIEIRRAVQELLHITTTTNAEPQAPRGGSHIAAGDAVGRYRVLGQIGQGGMSEVWLAHDLQLDRRVALKFLATGAVRGDSIAEITAEARAASALNHPNIVTIFEVIEHSSSPVIVMEIVEGPSLRSVAGVPQPVERVIEIGVQIARALEVAHANDTVHRDVKPENILIRPDGLVKLVDFGLSFRATSGAGNAGVEKAGTPRYMSPEQARGQRLGPPTDIYSFGQVLFELVTGRRPFADATAEEAAEAVAAGERMPRASSLRDDVPPELDALIEAMLQTDPAKRPAAAQVAARLQRIGQPDIPRTGVLRWMSTNPVRAIGLMGAIVAMLTAALVWVARSSRAPYAERQVTSLTSANYATATAISRDGAYAAYANGDGIFVTDLETSRTDAWSLPERFLVEDLAWFPDGEAIAVSGFEPANNLQSVWLSYPGGRPAVRIRADARKAVPSPDGKRVALIAGERSSVWLMGRNGEDAMPVATDDTDLFHFVYWSADGSRIGVGRKRSIASQKLNQLQYRHETIDARTGRRLAIHAAPDMAGAWTVGPDRLLWISETEDKHAVYSVKIDPRTGVFSGPSSLVVPADREFAAFSVSADGRRILLRKVSVEGAIMVADWQADPPRLKDPERFSFTDRVDYPHAWTGDSQSLIFESNRNGTWDIFRQQISSRVAHVAASTPKVDVLPQLSPDGKWILFASFVDGLRLNQELLQVPVTGGDPVPVPLTEPLGEFKCALLPNRRCVMRTTVAGKTVSYFELDPAYGKGRLLAELPWYDGVQLAWDLSPDGTRVAIPDHRPTQASVRIVQLDPRNPRSIPHEVRLEGLTDLNGAVWSQDAKAWFVSVKTPVRRRLFYATTEGVVTHLLDTEGWAVPSPDGRKVAYLDHVTSANAWLLTMR